MRSIPGHQRPLALILLLTLSVLAAKSQLPLSRSSQRSSQDPMRRPQTQPQPATKSPGGKKYPALLWEITGNGLKKPSWLFGTMHMSSKMVFRLSDSFYLALKGVDVVALEEDPELWQDQLFRHNSQEDNMDGSNARVPDNHLTQWSFQLEPYTDKLKAALTDQPTLINGLLYRSNQGRGDYEEDTYLDLYIYQTGKKLGKLTTGVENYFQTIRLLMEAEADQIRERKGGFPPEVENRYAIIQQTDDAYRKGDLDVLDSLESILDPSPAYMEKFLYQRNEIQASSIDSILRHHSLFVGVGAAHLPGKRGVIEILRKKGYRLRPVVMQDRDATQKDTIDKIRVPVHFSPFTSDDGSFTVALPGKLYRRQDTRFADSWQYADMSNGAYYMIGCVKTNSSFLGQKEEGVLQQVDSLLYEYIPGKIVKKTPLLKNGHKGFDITSRTRRGDIQRYNILVTPREVMIFKMSGNGSYVEGREADQFFGSIEIKNQGPAGWTDFSPPQGGFRIRMPAQPFQHRNAANIGHGTRWEYEADDPVTGNAFLVWKKTVLNTGFLEEDTINLALMEESFQSAQWLDKTLSRQTGTYKGYPCLDASYLTKDGSTIRIRCILKGTDDYLLAARSRKNQPFPEFFDSVTFTPYRHSPLKNYMDRIVGITVNTPIIPEIDSNARDFSQRAFGEAAIGSGVEYGNYWPHAESSLFQDDSTGEMVFVTCEDFSHYYYAKDSASFWKDEVEKGMNDLTVLHKEAFRTDDSISGFKYVLSDTNSSCRLNEWFFLKNDRLYSLICQEDSVQSRALLQIQPFSASLAGLPGSASPAAPAGQDSGLIARFYASLRPLDKRSAGSIFRPRTELFFHDLFSTDSTLRRRAKMAIQNVYFGAAGIPALLRAIGSAPPDDKEYFTIKTKLIDALGDIDDSAGTAMAVKGLKAIYEKVGDTSVFQHAVLKALAHQKTGEAYDLLKVLLVQDPPIFDDATDYVYLFNDLKDSLALARSLFPGLMQLAAVDDYKDNIRSLLAILVDSGYLKAGDYRSYFSQLYFDAKIQWKKQESKDEKNWEKKDDDAEPGLINDDAETPDAKNNELEDYAILLLPFYDGNATLPHFFDKLLQSRNVSLRLSTALLLIRDHKPVADSILYRLAAGDEYRSLLLKGLRAAHAAPLFPNVFNNQLAIARSRLVAGRSGIDVEYIDKRMIRCGDKKGFVYFFKYRLKKDNDWEIGFSGLQPIDGKEVSCGSDEEDNDNDLVTMTHRKLRANEPVTEQFDKLLRRYLIARRKSGAIFWVHNHYFNEDRDDE